MFLKTFLRFFFVFFVSFVDLPDPRPLVHPPSDYDAEGEMSAGLDQLLGP